MMKKISEPLFWGVIDGLIFRSGDAPWAMKGIHPRAQI